MKSRAIVEWRVMYGIILLRLLVAKIRQREIKDHHLELDALSYEDYVLRKTPKLVNGRLSKTHVLYRFWSVTAQAGFARLQRPQ